MSNARLAAGVNGTKPCKQGRTYFINVKGGIDAWQKDILHFGQGSESVPSLEQLFEKLNVQQLSELSLSTVHTMGWVQLWDLVAGFAALKFLRTNLDFPDRPPMVVRWLWMFSHSLGQHM